jgi:hypothetical protein
MIEEPITGFDVTSYFIYRVAEFLVMLSHDTLHSKQVIKVQDLIKHCDLLLASGHEPETHGEYFLFLPLRDKVFSFWFSFIGVRTCCV